MGRRYGCKALMVLSLAGCSGVGNPAASGPPLSFNDYVVRHQAAVQAAQLNFSAGQLRAALRIVAQTLLNRDATEFEMQTAVNGIAAYSATVQSYLAGPDFVTNQIHYYQNFFSLTGQVSGVDYDEPAHLAAFLSANDHDFREILTAPYCVSMVGGVLTQGSCSAFGDAAAQAQQGAGVLTTKAYLTGTRSAFYFHRANAASTLFACRNLATSPDLQDHGLLVNEISAQLKTFNCTTCNPACYGCHNNLNPRASLFYAFDWMGNYDPNPTDPALAAQTDTGAVSTVADLLTPGASPRFLGRQVSSVQDFAKLFADNIDFRDCLAQRLTNILLGRQPTDPLVPELQDIRDHVVANGYNVKKILLEAATHPGFVAR